VSADEATKCGFICERFAGGCASLAAVNPSRRRFAQMDEAGDDGEALWVFRGPGAAREMAATLRRAPGHRADLGFWRGRCNPEGRGNAWSRSQAYLESPISVLEADSPQSTLDREGGSGQGGGPALHGEPRGVGSRVRLPLPCSGARVL
jgi:hypothetical protein